MIKGFLSVQLENPLDPIFRRKPDIKPSSTEHIAPTESDRLTWLVNIDGYTIWLSSRERYEYFIKVFFN